MMRKYRKGMILILSFLLITMTCYGAKKKEEPIPKMTSLEQIAPNTIRVTYDRQVDGAKGMDINNYWIQILSDEEPDEIASLGKNDKVSSQNTLSLEKAQIIAQDNTNKAFLIRFKQKIPQGKKYKVIICYVTAPESKPYTGDNGTMIFTGK